MDVVAIDVAWLCNMQYEKAERSTKSKKKINLADLVLKWLIIVKAAIWSYGVRCTAKKKKIKKNSA